MVDGERTSDGSQTHKSRDGAVPQTASSVDACCRQHRRSPKTPIHVVSRCLPLSDQQADARDAAGIDVAHPPTGVQPLGRDAVVHCLRPRRRSLVVPPLCRAGDRQTQWCGETRKDPVVDMSARACAGEVAVQGWCGGDVTIRGDSERVRRSPVVAPVEKITSSPVPRGDGPPPLLVSAGGCSPPESDPRRFVPPLGRHLHHL
ncbi:hypothetical protein BHM03_00060605 [Ensete ventricosum]|nr:hypothetical protein BHM03_00060605 [Ensete ventricosum]